MARSQLLKYHVREMFLGKRNVAGVDIPGGNINLLEQTESHPTLTGSCYP